MSKPRSGLFQGTIGERAITGPEQIIAARTAGFDLREHPITQKQLSSKRMQHVSAKIASRTASKAEYKALMWNKRFSARRREGINAFWRQERARIINGDKPTRNWSSKQIEAIIHHRIPSFKGVAIHAHHSYSASKFPHLANRGEVIYPATHREHHKGWHGGNYKKSLPGRRIRIIVEF